MTRFDKLPLVLSALTVALLGCGANETSTQIDGSVFGRAQALPQSTGTQFERIGPSKSARSASAAAAARNPTATEFFTWAEATFPTLFPTKGANQTFEIYTYRYYPSTDLILALTDNTVLGLVGVTSNAPRVVQLGSLSDFTCLVLPALCTGTPAAIDATSVGTGLAEVGAFMSVCSKTGKLGSPSRATLAKAPEPSYIARSLEMRRVNRAIVKSADSGPVRATGTAPADKLGDCGGRMSHPVYSHVNGITTATNQFDNYCQTDTDTGEKQVVNGSLSYVKTGTPTASGPITTKLVSNSPAGLSFITKSAGGATLTSQTFSFNNYVYTPGVPGGDSTSANPDRIQIDEFQIGDSLTGKNYRQTGYTLTTFDVAGGGSQMSISGRGYRSNGAYYDMSTTTPVMTNKSGDFASGAFTFNGAGGSTAVATLVPGSALQATMTVNGVALTSVPACTN